MFIPPDSPSTPDTHTKLGPTSPTPNSLVSVETEVGEGSVPTTMAQMHENGNEGPKLPL